MTVLLLFSSPHSVSTGFRSENTWQEIRDHSFIQNHSRSSDSQLLLFSSPHSCSTGFRSEDWKQKLGFVLSDPFLSCFWGLCLDYCTLEDPNIAHYKISNRVSHLLIVCVLVFDRIHELNMLQIVLGWARIFLLETLPNIMWGCGCYLDIF